MRLVTIDSEYTAPLVAACYLRVQGGEAAFIETNTTHAVPRLLSALEQERLRPEDVRWVIVTHVHLDHAGGASALLRACPDATLVAHPRAARHLIDPSKLVASAGAVYGPERFRELYGSIEPIPSERVRVVEDGETLDLGGQPLRFLHTRGHANHHFVVHDPARDTVYTGDAFGIAYPQVQRAGRFVFATTSPTDFDAAAARESVDRIVALGTSTACPTHFGEIDRLDVAAAQLRWWIDRSERLVEEAIALPAERADAHLHAGVSAAMEGAARRAGLSLNESDRKLLALDVELNAQGLAIVAAKRRGA
jgi:glyoxylase-like metal-dependent hydrolase (beta-lactamase superfamily II)